MKKSKVVIPKHESNYVSDLELRKKARIKLKELSKRIESSDFDYKNKKSNTQFSREVSWILDKQIVKTGKRKGQIKLTVSKDMPREDLYRLVRSVEYALKVDFETPISITETDAKLEHNYKEFRQNNPDMKDMSKEQFKQIVEALGALGDLFSGYYDNGLSLASVVYESVPSTEVVGATTLMDIVKEGINSSEVSNANELREYITKKLSTISF